MPRSVTARACEALREHGPRQLWFRALGELGYRRQLVTELRLPAAAVIAPQIAGLDARFLGDADLEDYAALHGGDGEASDRFARGERCFGVWLDGRLVSTRWLATGTAHLGYLRRDVPLEPGDVYLYETFTAPDQRGRGISGLAGAAVPADLAGEGARRLVAVLEPENASGIRGAEKAGYRIVGTIGYVRLGPWRRDFGSLR